MKQLNSSFAARVSLDSNAGVDLGLPQTDEGEEKDKRRFCEALGSPPFVAVISRWDEDVAWTLKLPIPSIVYEHAKPLAFYNVPVNKGSEASAYLQFILDHFDCLPKWMLFLHGHGQTAATGDRPQVVYHHPTDAATHAALIDVDAVGRPFLGLCHFSQAGFERGNSLKKEAKKFCVVPKSGPTAPAFHCAYQPTSAGLHPCGCDTLARLLGPELPCPTGWGFNMAAEFWVSRSRISRKPVDYWKTALAVAVSGVDKPRFGHHGDGSKASAAGYCMESVWHALMGEPLVGYRPAFRDYVKDLPRSPAAERCRAGSVAASVATRSDATTIGGALDTAAPNRAVGVTEPAAPRHFHERGILGAFFPSHTRLKENGTAAGLERGEATPRGRELKSSWAYLTKPSAAYCGPWGNF